MPKAIKCLASGLVVFSIALFFFSPIPARSQSKVLESMPGGPPIPMIAIPEDFFFRVVPSPVRLSIFSQLSTFNVNYLSGGTNAWGDTCTSWPTEAQTAFSYAASVWATYLQSSVPITINACWATNLASPILGHSGSTNFLRNFSGAPLTDTWYPVSLANALHGSDLDLTNADMEIAYSTWPNWYFGTNGYPGSGQSDFVSVVMHEITHGLGFLGSMGVSGGLGNWGWGSGYPVAYDRFTENGSGQDLLNTTLFPNPSATLATQLTSGSVYFNGPNANAANGGNRPKLYAPGTWAPGSSYAHLDYSLYYTTENRLMVYALTSGTAIHLPGPITLGILQDLGWPASSPGAMVYVFPTGYCGGKTPCYSSIDDGIDSEGAVLTVNISEDEYIEEVILDDPKILTLRGGWDSTFDNQISSTIIHGLLAIIDGMAIVENIILW